MLQLLEIIVQGYTPSMEDRRVEYVDFIVCALYKGMYSQLGSLDSSDTLELFVFDHFQCSWDLHGSHRNLSPNDQSHSRILQAFLDNSWCPSKCQLYCSSMAITVCPCYHVKEFWFIRTTISSICCHHWCTNLKVIVHGGCSKYPIMVTRSGISSSFTLEISGCFSDERYLGIVFWITLKISFVHLIQLWHAHPCSCYVNQWILASFHGSLLCPDPRVYFDT